jgi:hypothetical protein
MDIEDNKQDKPSLPKTPQYRYPKGHPSGKGGKFMKPEVAEKIMSEGGTVTVSPSTGAVSAEGVAKYNEELKKYINNLAQQSFQAGFASSFRKDSDKDSSQSEFAKLFDTISNKVINRIGNVNSNILELKKQNSEQSVKLLNLTTSMYSAMSSQKDTMDELYKVIDTKLGQLIDKLDTTPVAKSDMGSPNNSDDNIEILYSITDKLDKIHNSIIFSGDVQSGLLDSLITLISDKFDLESIEKVTPKPDVLQHEQDGSKDPASKPTIIKKDESKSQTISKTESSITGAVGQILGGAAIMSIGAIVDAFKDKLPELLTKFTELTKHFTDLSDTISGVKTFVEDLFSFDSNDSTKKVDESQLPKNNNGEPLLPNLEYKGEPVINKGPKYDDFTKAIKQKREESPKKTLINRVKGFFEELSTDIDTYFERSKDSNKNLDGTPSQLLPEQKRQLEEEKQKRLQKKSKKTNGSILDNNIEQGFKKSPLGEYSIVNNATNPLPSITGNIVSNPISPMTQAIQQSSSEIELAKQNSLNNTIKQSHAIILNNNQQSAPQQPTIINPPTPRNTDSTKAFLDKMVLMGGYTGSGILLN